MMMRLVGVGLLLLAFQACIVCAQSSNVYNVAAGLATAQAAQISLQTNATNAIGAAV